MINEGGYPALITNRHIVTGRRQSDDQPISKHGGVPDKILVSHHGATLGSWVEEEVELYNEEGKPKWLEHSFFGRRVDVVAVPLVQRQYIQYYAYDAGGGHPILVGPAEVVSVIGFPFGQAAGGLFPIWATGFIASEPKVDVNDLPIIYIDCRSRQGQSGSPVVAYRPDGRFVIDEDLPAFAPSGSFSKTFDVLQITGAAYRLLGVYSGRINEQSDIGIVWKLPVILAVMRYGTRPSIPFAP